MKAVLEDMRSGKVMAYEVPQPELRRADPGTYGLFRDQFGNRTRQTGGGEKSLMGKAMARPDLVRQVMDFARNEASKAAYQRVQSRLDSLHH